MAKQFRPSTADVQDMAAEVIKQFHPELEEAMLKLDLVDAFDSGGGSAVKHHGLPAVAVIRIVPLKERCMGRGDAEITFDALVFGRLSETSQKAVIDHELYHLERKRNKDGQIVYDDLGRVCYTIRPHDREFGWFDVIANRWGEHSLEAIQAKEMVRDVDFRRLYLGILPKSDTPVEGDANANGGGQAVDQGPAGA